MNKKRLAFLFALPFMFMLTEAEAATCTWTSFQSHGIYAYGFEVGVNENGSINSIQLYLGKYIGSMANKTDSITYNGQVYTLGAFMDSICLGKNCTSSRYEYQACYVPAGPTFSYTTTQDQAFACPATTPSGYLLERRTYDVYSDGSTQNYGAWYLVANYCSAIYSYTGYQNQNVACPATTPSGTIVQQRSYQVYTDGSVVNYSAWTTISNTCVAVYKSTGYNTSTSACPATTPSGIITLQQSYQIYTDGSLRNYSAWTTVSNTCTAVYKSTQTKTQTLACTAPYADGGNGITQTQTSELWTDGTTHNVGAWVTTGNTCYKTVTDTQPNVTGTCAEGQTGSIITKQVRTHKEYSTDSTKTAAQQAALNEQNATAWTTVVVTNTCVNVPDQVTSTPGTRQLSCAAVYGGLASDYTGSVTETGTNVSTYSSATKQTTTTFKSNTPPTYNSTCQATVSDVTMETTTQACPAGETGTVSLYRYVSTDSKGVKTYPNGTDYIESSNTCQSNTASADTSVADANTVQSKGLLANNTIKTSSLLTKTDMETFISTLDKSTMTTDSTYKLNLIVDDLSTGMYNKSNVVGTVNAFKNATGQNPIITVPQSLDKYIGNGGITATNYKTFILQSAVLNSDNQVVVTYSTLASGINKGTVSTFTVNLLN